MHDTAESGELVAAAVSDDTSCRYHLVSRVGWCKISHSCATYYCHASSLEGATRLPHPSEPYHADLSRRGDNQLRQIGNTALLREDAFESGRASKCAREALIRMATNQFLDSFGPTRSWSQTLSGSRFAHAVEWSLRRAPIQVGLVHLRS